MDIATIVFHPASDPWFTDGLSASSDATQHTALYTEKPSDVPALFTDQYPTTERTFDNTLRNADYSSNFILVYEARMLRADAYQVAPTIQYDELAWTGWRTVTAPMVRASRNPTELGLAPKTTQVIATTVTRYSTDASPRRVRAPVYDEETGSLVTEVIAQSSS